jgi:hypothetical protein
VIVTVASVTGSPGATTLAVGLAAAWPTEQPRLLLEADPDGGRLAAQIGINVEPGLVELAVTARSGLLDRADFERCSAPMGEWSLLPGPPSAEQSASALAGSSAFAAGMSEGVWIVDAGRLSTRSPALPLAIASRTTIVVTHGDLAHLQLLPHRIDSLTRAGCAVAVAVVEPTHWSADEIASFVGADVLGLLPKAPGRHDLTDLGYRAWRPWWNAVRGLCSTLASEREMAHD